MTIPASSPPFAPLGQAASPLKIGAKGAGLEVWMQRVLERVEKVHPDWNPEDIHGLRVALRRCRTMAEVLSEVNPSPHWNKVKKSSRDLFQAMGDLRDTQVRRQWLKKLGARGEPLSIIARPELARREKSLRKNAETALESFDCKSWRKAMRKLSGKAIFFPLESVVFQRLALSKLNEAVALFQEARKKRTSAAWHRLRIGLKQFRYTVENFLPQRYEVWSTDLRAMQDLLGDVHDLDMLRSEIRRHASKVDSAVIAEWREKIARERKARLQEFLSKATGPDSPWIVWRAGFHLAHPLTLSPARRKTA